MLLGAVADDLTGATDLSLTLARGGMKTVQVVGVPGADLDVGDAEAVVVALKSRTVPAPEAVARSLAAARALLEREAGQIIFKYCSTFDSTPEGNIGPVADALLDVLGEKLTIVCPAFPANGRTIYMGHLFVGNALLSDSSMKDHPLTPMTDANLVRFLQLQTKSKVGLVPHSVVRQGAAAITNAFKEAAERGERMVVVDAIADQDLHAIGHAAAGLKLITGGSGIALGLPENFRAKGRLSKDGNASSFKAPEGPSVMLAGSCSAATRRQIETAVRAGVPTLRINPFEVASGRTTAKDIASWILAQGAKIPLAYSSADPEEMRRVQSELGRDEAGQMIEHLMGEVAKTLMDNGYRRFLVAGGETSGAVVNALGIKALRIGPEIDPGVPWTVSIGEPAPLALALKSGNFGTDDFMIKAWNLI